MDLMMFACDRCNNLDTLALSKSEGDGFLCYRCRHGEWHHVFEETKYDPSKHRGLTNRVDQGTDPDSDPSFG